MKTITKSQLRKECLASAIKGTKLGLAIGIPIGAAIGAPIFGVGAIANAAICGAIGTGIGAGIGALIPLIKYRKYKIIDDISPSASLASDEGDDDESNNQDSEQDTLDANLRNSNDHNSRNGDEIQSALNSSLKANAEPKLQRRSESIKPILFKNQSSLFHHGESRQSGYIDKEGSEEVAEPKRFHS